jgi:hypothetical protein
MTGGNKARVERQPRDYDIRLAPGTTLSDDIEVRKEYVEQSARMREMRGRIFPLRRVSASLVPFISLGPSRPPTAPMPASVSDAEGSRAESDLHTNARHQFVIESQMWECPRAAAGSSLCFPSKHSLSFFGRVVFGF